MYNYIEKSSHPPFPLKSSHAHESFLRFSDFAVTPILTTSRYLVSRIRLPLHELSLSATTSYKPPPQERNQSQRQLTQRQQDPGSHRQLHLPEFRHDALSKMFATKALRQASAAAERTPLIKFLGKRSIPGMPPPNPSAT